MNKRSELFVRAMIDEVQAVCNTIRASYPERYPVPPEVDAMLKLEDSLLARARSGELRNTEH